MSINLDAVIRSAKKLGGYFITITTLDSSRTENNLQHYAFREKFNIDDIVPSLDASLRSLEIKSKQPTPTVQPPLVESSRVQPKKIAIITHFNRCPDGYSPGKAVKNQIKILQQYGHEVVFFTSEGSKLDVGCEMRPVVTKFKREKNIVNEEAKQKFIDVLREQLTDDFDLAITHDLYIDDCITYREAIMECGVDIKWLHWARSGVGRPINFKMDNTRYVYMNHADKDVFADRIGVDRSKIRVCFNEKDPSLLYEWDDFTTHIVDKMKMWEKDIVQIYPLCTTRMDAKGLNSVIEIFGKLKKMGNKVALVICNSNGRRRIDEINAKIKKAEQAGLVNNQDIIFTSTLADEQFDVASATPHKVVVELMQLSNLFIFPTLAEVCSNVLLEASMTKNLLVLNSDLPSLMDFADSNSVLTHPFTSLMNVHYTGRDNKALESLAKNINGQIKANKADLQMRRVWRKHNINTLYHEMLEPIIFE